MAERQSYLIIGNGIAGITAAEVLRVEDGAADITVVADDPCPVYYRPALKDFLGGKIREEKLWARPTHFYQSRRVRFINDAVVGIQSEAHTVQLRGGQSLPYSRLLLAHGARATTLTCQGVNLQGVTTLRTVADYQQALVRLNGVKRVVVVGAGTLALESVETLRHRSINVTHLLRRRTLWSDVLDHVASDLVLQQEERDGVDVRYEQEIAEVIGKNGQVVGIVTTTGKQIACELVLLGIGIDPITDFVKASGIACGRGVKVDGMMRTNAPDIYAAGDLIETTDPISGRTRVIGQWYPAIQQARAAAYSMVDLLDTQHVFRFGNFYNACFLYGLDFASVGLSSIPKDGKDYQELTADPQPRMYQKVILKGGIPVGALALGDRKCILALKRAIDHGINLSPVTARLFSPDFSLEQWMDTQGVPAAIIGVSREGEVAVNTLAYGSGNKSATLTAHKITEAVLVPLVSPDTPSEVRSVLKEQYLSQMKTTTIGRQENATIPIHHHSISRRHAEIGFANGQYILRDLGSKNGTFINDVRLEANSTHILHADDRIDIGSITWTFRLRQVGIESSLLLKNLIVDLARPANPLPVVPNPTHANPGLVCSSCGTPLNTGARFCPKCGQSAGAQFIAPNMSNISNAPDKPGTASKTDSSSR
jgi:NADPH-dependent 2,4-dienoyl-CoA reductase/sulfur reductase-like enzyme/pSer/pThr/pTyr-binding forkhead associated (FHA) protein